MVVTLSTNEMYLILVLFGVSYNSHYINHLHPSSLLPARRMPRLLIINNHMVIINFEDYYHPKGVEVSHLINSYLH
jgi:hypothetical protein